MKNYAKFQTIALFESKSIIVDIEVVILPGLPCLELIGLPDATMRESKNRVRAAIISSGYRWPQGRIIASYAPAGLHKQGSAFDLALALGILKASGQIDVHPSFEQALTFGELALSGNLQRVDSLLAKVIGAELNHTRCIIVPANDDLETALLGNISSQIYALDTLTQVVQLLSGLRIRDALECSEFGVTNRCEDREIKPLPNQIEAWRAALVAVCGWHHFFVLGTPGSGKTTLLEQMIGWLPPLSRQEQLDKAYYYSLNLQEISANDFNKRQVLRLCGTQTKNIVAAATRECRQNPFAKYWQGSVVIDEANLTDQSTVDALTTTLHLQENTTGNTIQTRSNRGGLVIGAANPCHCGYAYEANPRCTCSAQNRRSYLSRWTGGFWDRVDIVVPMRRANSTEISASVEFCTNSLGLMKQTIARCWQRQYERCVQANLPPLRNGLVPEKEIANLFYLSDKLLAQVRPLLEKKQYSTRSYFKMLKIARTVADLAESDEVLLEHVYEAIKLQGKELVP